jgi:c(7)-type cytochrome triheme protein
MRRSRIATLLCTMAAIGLLVVAVASAQSRMPKLPEGYTFAQSGDSPGKVTFNHASHVDEKAPSCTACHPKLFKILTQGAPTGGGKITHDAMNKGQSCGACHNGKKSFGADDCTLCHRN